MGSPKKEALLFQSTSDIYIQNLRKAQKDAYISNGVFRSASSSLSSGAPSIPFCYRANGFMLYKRTECEPSKFWLPTPPLLPQNKVGWAFTVKFTEVHPALFYNRRVCSEPRKKIRHKLVIAICLKHPNIKHIYAPTLDVQPAFLLSRRGTIFEITLAIRYLSDDHRRLQKRYFLIIITIYF